MLDLFRQLKLEFKSGNFYLSFDEDAVVLNKVFNFKINELKNNIKVGFPINSLEKYIGCLNELKINYLIIENKNIINKSSFENNKFKCYYGSVFDIISMNNRINNIYNKLKEFDDVKKESCIKKIEDIIMNL